MSQVNTIKHRPNCVRLVHLDPRSEEHTSELQSQSNLVCRLLLEKKKYVESYVRNQSVTSDPPRTLITWPVPKQLQRSILDLPTIRFRHATPDINITLISLLFVL